MKRNHLKLVHDEPVRGPSKGFIALTRNPDLAKMPPVRFEPTIKQAGDIVL
jgi:hypothetical protein